MSPDPQVELERIRALCMAFPMAAEKLSHGAPTFFVEKGKVYAYFWHNHHGDDRTAVLVKTSGGEEQAMLVDADPDTYFIPPYLGPSHWVGLRLDGPDLDWDRVAHRIRLSWDMIAPPRLRALFD